MAPSTKFSTRHRITVCTSCKHKGNHCRPGYELIDKLRRAIAEADDAVPEDFEISGVACMAGCDRPCTVAKDGWCSSVDRPGKLRRTTLARVPAAMMVIEESEAQVS